MSVFNLKSTVIANRDATPKVLTDSIQAISRIKQSIGVQQTGDAIMAAASTIKLCIVPSRARVASIEYAAQSLGTSGLDIAVWYPTTIQTGIGNSSAVAGALISSSAFTGNIAGVDTGIAWTDAQLTPSTVSLQKRTQPLWQMLGLALDPEMDLDVGFTVRTATSVQGYVGLRVSFAD